MKAHGKLLLTGEYAVLDGAKALATPLIYGQSMKISAGRGCDIMWEAYDESEKEWFSARISLYDFKALKTTDEDVANKLTEVLNQACRLNSDFLSTWKGMKVKTTLDFPQKYGWGTSSTLYTLVAEWADVDAFDLMRGISDGSGYDVICASANGPLLFQLKNGVPEYVELDWNPSFMKNLYLVYQGEKKNTEEAIDTYYKKDSSEEWIERISQLTTEFIEAEDLKKLNDIIVEHENLLGERLGLRPIKQELFSDFWGQVKSLGAWGGDFALVTSERNSEETKAYFEKKGLDTFFSLDSVMLKSGKKAEAL